MHISAVLHLLAFASPAKGPLSVSRVVLPVEDIAKLSQWTRYVSGARNFTAPNPRAYSLTSILRVISTLSLLQTTCSVCTFLQARSSTTKLEPSCRLGCSYVPRGNSI